MNSKRWMKGKTWMAVGLSLVLVLTLLAGCGKKESSNTGKQRVLRIATSMGYGPNDEYFRQQFTDIFEYVNKDIKIEIIPTVDETYYYGYGKMGMEDGEQPQDPMEKLKELMDSATPPDVIMTSYDQLGELIQENRLKPLDTLMTKSNFNMDDFVPAIVEGLKELSPDGKLYALSPTFNSSALVYNLDIFNNAGVPLPTDGMTWDDVFNLAKRVTQTDGDHPVYGFGFNRYPYTDLFSNGQIYAAPLGLRMFDDELTHMTINTDQWKSVWNTLLDLKEQHIMPEPPDRQNMVEPMERGPFDNDYFLSGKLAMTIIHNSEIDQLINVNKNAANIKNFEPINWDVVTFPVHSQNPEVGGDIYMNGLMGINARAQNADDAWKFISFINGEDWVKLKSNSVNYFVSRKAYNKPKEGMNYNIEAFFQLKPAAPIVDNNLYRTYQNLYRVQSIGQQKLQQVENGDETLDQALQEWETEGNALLPKIKENPSGQLDMDASAGSISIQKEMLRKAAGQ